MMQIARPQAILDRHDLSTERGPESDHAVFSEMRDLVRPIEIREGTVGYETRKF